MDGSQQTSQPLIFNDPAYASAQTVQSNAGVWDVSQWDNAKWGGGYNSLVQPYYVAPMTGHLNYLSTATKWMPAGEPARLRSPGIQVTIAWNGGVPDFKLAGYSLTMLFRGQGFVGQQPYTTEGQVNFNPSNVPPR
jgi:hypothetical protein